MAIKLINNRWGLTPLIITILTMLVVVTGFNYWQGRVNTSQPVPAQPPTTEPSFKITPSLTTSPLSDQEKIGQMLAMPVVLSDDPSEEFWQAFETVRPAVVSIFGDNISSSQVQKFSQEVKSRSSDWLTQPMLAVDHEGGQVQRLSGSGFTKLPTWREVCQLPDAERFALLEKVALELESVGIDLVYGPVVDLFSLQSSLGNRACDSDPNQVTLQALDLINIFKRHGIHSVIKHYPGLGQGTVDTHFGYEKVALDADDVEPFRQILTQNPDTGVMVAHVGVAGIYERPCSLTEACIVSLREAAPHVVMFADALDMKSVYDGGGVEAGDLTTVSTQAIEAGIDVLIFGRGVGPDQFVAVFNDLVDEYQASLEMSKLVEQSASRWSNFQRDMLVP